MSDRVNLVDLLGDSLISAQGDPAARVPVRSLDGKTVGLYFSAGWCAPCRKFTPRLLSLYQNLNTGGSRFEVVFVSSDRDEAQFQAYFKDMPWLALPFKDSKLRNSVAQTFGVMGIPTLVLLGPDGKILNENARGAVLQDPEGAGFPWEGQSDLSGGGIRPWKLALLVILMWFLAKLIIN
ncbi:hypothetical protein WJX72_010971 [[Myrmecia] bisecta]|uniref:Thioredoxin domain-containing protein n=1 Tax=[Myrmecia] bisecta TaxID=41462 RepID=A0AAW1P4P7_9CHLO